MRIAVFAENVPSAEHRGGAVSKVLDSLIAELLARGQQVVLQLILAEKRRDWTAQELQDFARLDDLGVEVLPAFFSSDYRKGRSHKGVFARVRKMAAGLVNPLPLLYPAVHLRPQIEERLRKAGADVALIFWSPEGVAATYQVRQVPKVVYHGMPDFAAYETHLQDRELFEDTRGGYVVLKDKVWLHLWKRCHLALMKDCDIITNLCADHADYYRRSGHPRSEYLNNMWPRFQHEQAPGDGPQRRPHSRPKIFGSLGRLNTTGNS